MSSLFKGLFGVDVSVTSQSNHVPNEGSAPPPPEVYYVNSVDQMPVGQAEDQAPVANHHMDATEDEWVGSEQGVDDDADQAIDNNDVAADDVIRQA
ncbi:hypothetical protein FRC11_001374 [Ceratobasidium sp. 423]|nr:hypothetical protein FRC11_001374 [Ceratobasidium sp. 423]